MVAGYGHADLAAYLDRLRANEPFAAHEALETAWRREGDVLCGQGAAQGLIQVAAAYVQRGRGNAYGARLLAERAAARLGAPLGVAVRETLAAAGIDAAALADRLEALARSAAPADWPAPASLVVTDDEASGPSSPS